LVFALLVLGYGLRRAGVFADAAADALNRFVVYVSLPAMVLLQVPKLHWEPRLWLLVATPWAMLVVAACCVVWAARVFRWPRPVLGALLLCVPLGNTSFIGIPIVAALRGEDAVPHALIYDQLGSFLMLATYGSIVLTRFTGDASPTWRSIVSRVLTFPPFLALVVALLPLPHPVWVDATLQRVADTLVPLALFAVGLRLKLSAPEHSSALIAGLATKMLACPLLVLAVVDQLDAIALPAKVAVLEAAMPPMISAGALASMAGLAPELCAALVGYGVIIAFVSLPLFNLLL
jgi:predicted permease